MCMQVVCLEGDLQEKHISENTLRTNLSEMSSLCKQESLVKNSLQEEISRLEVRLRRTQNALTSKTSELDACIIQIESLSSEVGAERARFDRELEAQRHLTGEHVKSLKDAEERVVETERRMSLLIEKHAKEIELLWGQVPSRLLNQLFCS